MKDKELNKIIDIISSVILNYIAKGKEKYLLFIKRNTEYISHFIYENIEVIEVTKYIIYNF